MKRRAKPPRAGTESNFNDACRGTIRYHDYEHSITDHETVSWKKALAVCVYFIVFVSV